MYIPKSFENKNLAQLHDLMERYNFATMISEQEGEIMVTHIPVLLDRARGEYGSLSFHVANLNPHSAHAGDKKVLFIFTGPHAYISPTWYEMQPSVPTWNYTAVHVSGVPVRITKEELAADLTKLVDQHESLLHANYVIPQNYKDKLIEHISGFRMEITNIVGKFKLGQNRAPLDQAGMLQGLRKQNTPDAIALADFIDALKSKN